MSYQVWSTRVDFKIPRENFDAAAAAWISSAEVDAPGAAELKDAGSSEAFLKIVFTYLNFQEVQIHDGFLVIDKYVSSDGGPGTDVFAPFVVPGSFMEFDSEENEKVRETYVGGHADWEHI